MKDMKEKISDYCLEFIKKDEEAFNVLELGPGDSLNTGLISFSLVYSDQFHLTTRLGLV